MIRTNLSFFFVSFSKLKTYMTDFINNIFSFPTLFYTGLLTLVILYWLASSFGLADFDIADGMELDVSDVADGSGWMNRFKLDGIPLTISISFIIFISWVICFLLVHFYQGKIADSLVEIFVGFWVIILAPVVAAPIVGTLCSPLKPLFKKLNEDGEGRNADSLIGHLATIRTNKVTMTFGDAELDDEGANLILKVRAEEPNDLKRGDSVVITEYLIDENTYRVRSRT